MTKTLQWIISLSLVLIAAAVIFSVVWPVFAPRSMWGGSFGGMVGPGHMFGGRSMFGGFGLPFFGIGMMLWPLLFVGLIVLGVVWLVRGLTPPAATPPASGIFCSHCGKPLQAGWVACPYCGERVAA
jgi:hypothetical protein